MNRTPDRRPSRTRAELQKALLDLTVELGYRDVTVKHITDRANVGRSTFYLHFTDKDDLLMSGLADLRKLLLSRVHAQTSERDALASCVRAFFEHAQEYQRLYRCLSPEARTFLHSKLDAVFVEVAAEAIRRNRNDLQETYIGILAHAFAGAMLGAVAWWSKAAPDVTPGELTALFDRFLRRST